MQLHEEFDLDFFEDEQFIKNLTSHIIMLLDRLHQNITFRNPLIDTICVKYPLLWIYPFDSQNYWKINIM